MRSKVIRQRKKTYEKRQPANRENPIKTGSDQNSRFEIGQAPRVFFPGRPKESGYPTACFFSRSRAS
ncbi:hypothetical protein A8C56_01550 [Niabella ginsenosidivorans]|uniref:Uncharacterized protein n=1 Tax=Niabella ginsenosidivorans TaxID=1176587 RepID=A0A1A9HX66_9BACT|nr:hypothetical protein A8C56_01550 [Niabella ginsenosidivorans]